MKTLGHFIGISKQSEVLFLILLGICCTIFDASLVNLHSNLYKIWDVHMDSLKFTDTAQLYVQYIISTVVLVRTFTVHLYLAFYIVMLWPAIFEERPGLLLPWLIVGAVKCLAMGAVSLATGLYICLSYKFAKAACWDFVIAQVIDQGPAFYMWFCVLSYFRDLKAEQISQYRIRNSSTVFGLAERRRRARSLFASKRLQNSFDDNRHLISVSTIDTIVNQLNTSMNKGTSRSLDCLLDMMTAEAEKEEILNAYDECGEEDDTLTTVQKTMKMLKITTSSVNKAKRRRVGSSLMDCDDEDSLYANMWDIDFDDFPDHEMKNRPLLKKSHSDIGKINRMKMLKLQRADIVLIPSEAEVKVTALNTSDSVIMSKPSDDSAPGDAPSEKSGEKDAEEQLPEKQADASSKTTGTERVPPFKESTPPGAFVKHHIKNIANKQLSNPTKPSQPRTKALGAVSKSNTAAGGKPAAMLKANQSKLPRRKKEEGSQVNTITEDMLRCLPRDVNAYNPQANAYNPKTRGTAKPKTAGVKSKSLDAALTKPDTPFKHDGYTLAYMERQKGADNERGAARRPNSSGT